MMTTPLIAKVRLALNADDADLALLLGVARSTVSAMRNGTRTETWATPAGLAAVHSRLERRRRAIASVIEEVEAAMLM